MTGELAYRVKFFPIVYAACGEKSKGASLHEIKSRTGLELRIVEEALSELIMRGVVKKINNRYFAPEAHLLYAGLKQSQAFKAFFQHLLDNALAKSKSDFSSDTNLFFASCFSVPRSKLPQLKDDLRHVLVQYVDSCEDPEGDHIATIVCAQC